MGQVPEVEVLLKHGLLVFAIGEDVLSGPPEGLIYQEN
jgi:hypothetical protein